MKLGPVAVMFGRAVKTVPIWLAFCMAASTACDSSSGQSATAVIGVTQPSPVPPVVPVVPMTLSGQVFEILQGGRVPAPGNLELVVVVVSTQGCAPPCRSMTSFTYHRVWTGPDGRYSVVDLPAGDAVVLTDASKYLLACGAGTVLTPKTELDVEVTSRVNPHRSPTQSPLRISGQIYEMTESGRVGLAGAWLGLEHHGSDAPFLDAAADADGRYAACGIPAGWPMVVSASKPGYVNSYVWHQFGADSTFDIELKRLP